MGGAIPARRGLPSLIHHTPDQLTGSAGALPTRQMRRLAHVAACFDRLQLSLQVAERTRGIWLLRTGRICRYF